MTDVVDLSNHIGEEVCLLFRDGTERIGTILHNPEEDPFPFEVTFQGGSYRYQQGGNYLTGVVYYKDIVGITEVGSEGYSVEKLYTLSELRSMTLGQIADLISENNV
jgi:hypothetical protein